MTLKEFMEENYPDFAGKDCKQGSGVIGCPSHYTFLQGHYAKNCYDIVFCKDCWNQPYIETTDTTKPTEETDNVNHPKHYTGEIECIDAMLQTQGVEAVKGFYICNAFKYIWRQGNKNGVEDVEKAIWYLKKYIELVRGENKK